MPEDELVRANGQRKVPDRRLADFLAVYPDLGPGQRVQRDGRLGNLLLDGDSFTGLYIDGTGNPVPEIVVDELDIVLPAGECDAISAATDGLPLLEYLDDQRTGHRQPTGW